MDVQPFVKITSDVLVSNTSLEGLLLNNHTYYVTVTLVCVNGAGLKTTNISRGESQYYHTRNKHVYKLRQRLPVGDTLCWFGTTTCSSSLSYGSLHIIV